MEVIILWRIKLDRFYCNWKPASKKPWSYSTPVFKKKAVIFKTRKTCETSTE
jgi:hypothetical protein